MNGTRSLIGRGRFRERQGARFFFFVLLAPAMEDAAAEADFLHLPCHGTGHDGGDWATRHSPVAKTTLSHLCADVISTADPGKARRGTVCMSERV
jgi:hypothetical protein